MNNSFENYAKEKNFNLPKKDIEDGLALFLASDRNEVLDVLSCRECDLRNVRSSKLKRIISKWGKEDKGLFVEIINRKELKEHISYDDILLEIFNVSINNGYYDLAKNILSREPMELREHIAKNCINEVKDIFPNSELYYLLEEINSDSYNDQENWL